MRPLALAWLFVWLTPLAASAQLGGSINALGWSNPALYGLLALGYAYFLLVKPDAI